MSERGPERASGAVPQLEVHGLRLMHVVGGGAQGQVWRARAGAGEGGVDVAVKVFRHATDAQGGVQALLREARALSQLRHRHVVRVLDAIVVDEDLPRAPVEPGDALLVAEWVDGTPWRATSTASLVADALRLLDALAFAHARDVLHLDIKPPNVLSTDRGPVLVDFGLSQRAGRALRGSGTPGFMAPEQVDGDAPIGPWSDLFGLGATIATLLLGRPWSLAEGRVRIDGEPELERWLARVVEPAVADRFQHAAIAAAALAEVVPGLGAGAHEPQTLETASLVDDLPTLSNLGFGEVATVVTASSDARLPLPTHWRSPHHGMAPRDVPAGMGAALLDWRELPFLGRERTRDAIWAVLLSAVRDGEPRLAVVEGESGVGRSRLLVWLGRRLRELGAARVLSVACAGVSEPFRALLDAVAGQRELATGDDFFDTVLADLVAGDVDLEDLDEGLLSGLFAAWIDRRAADGLLVVLADDAEEAPEVLQLAERTRRRGTHAIVWVLAARPGTAAGSKRVDEVCRLEPLNEEQVREVLETTVGVSPALSSVVQGASNGRVATAVQLLRAWQRRGVLGAGPEGYVLADAPGDVPALDGSLPAACRYAAVLGVSGEVEAAMMCSLAGRLGGDLSHDAAEAALGALADADAVVETHGRMRWIDTGMLRAFETRLRAAPDPVGDSASEWLAAHRAAAALVDPERANTMSAEAIQRLERVTIDPAFERWARHAIEFGECDAVYEWVVRATDHLQPRYKPASRAGALRAVALAELALDRMDVAASDPRRGWLELARSSAYHEQQAEVASGLLEAARTHGWAEIEAMALDRFANSIYGRGQFDEALACLREARALATRPDVARPDIARKIDINIAYALSLKGEIAEAAARFRRVRSEARAAGHLAHEMRALALLASTICDIPAHYEEALEAADTVLAADVSKHSKMMVLVVAGYVHRVQGDYEAAERCLERSMRLRQSVGQTPWAERIHLLFARADRGAWSRVLADADGFMEQLWQTRRRPFIAMVELVRALATAALGLEARYRTHYRTYAEQLPEGYEIADRGHFLKQLAGIVSEHGWSGAEALWQASRDCYQALGDDAAAAGVVAAAEASGVSLDVTDGEPPRSA